MSLPNVLGLASPPKKQIVDWGKLQILARKSVHVPVPEKTINQHLPSHQPKKSNKNMFSIWRLPKS
jgi:hypothetical protein